MELVGTIVLLKPIELETEDCLSDPGSKFVSNFIAPLLVVLESIVLAPSDDELVVLDINEGFIGEYEPDGVVVLENLVESLEFESSTGDKRDLRSGVSLLVTLPASGKQLVRVSNQSIINPFGGNYHYR